MIPVRTAVVGFGWFFELLLDRVLPQVPDIEIIGACDVSIDRREAARARGIPAFETVGALLESVDCEAVAVLTPHDTHRMVIEEVAAAKRHVFCEKAMAVSAADCEAIIRVTMLAGVHLVVGHMQKLFPPYARVVDLARSGAYGDVLAVNVQGYHWCPVFDGWWRSKARCGGLLYWTGIHDLDTMRAVVGSEAGTVYAVASPKHDLYTEYEDQIAVTIHYENGAIGTLQVAAHEPLRTFEESFGMNVLCERGGIRYVPETRAVEHAGRKALERSEASIERFGTVVENENAGYRAELAHFASVVRGNELVKLTGEDGLRCVETLEAAYRSLASGNAEKVVRAAVATNFG